MPRKGCLWQLAHSWWVLLLFSFYYSWAAFFYIGIMARRWRWIVWGIVYSPVFWVDDLRPYLKLWQIGVLYMVAIPLYLISIVHGLLVLKEYLNRMQARSLGISYEEFVTMERVEQMKRQLPDTVPYSAENAANSAPTNRDMADFPPSGRISANTPPAPESKVININSATEDELAALPGVGVILAKKAIQHRDANRGFRTGDEFFELLLLKPHAIRRLRPLVTVGPTLSDAPPRDKPPTPPTDSPSTPPYGGRVVDY